MLKLVCAFGALIAASMLLIPTSSLAMPAATMPSVLTA